MATTQGNSDKGKALDLAIASIEKQFGKGSIMKLGDKNSVTKDIPAVSYTHLPSPRDRG